MILLKQFTHSFENNKIHQHIKNIILIYTYNMLWCSNKITRVLYKTQPGATRYDWLFSSHFWLVNYRMIFVRMACSVVKKTHISKNDVEMNPLNTIILECISIVVSCIFLLVSGHQRMYLISDKKTQPDDRPQSDSLLGWNKCSTCPLFMQGLRKDADMCHSDHTVRCSHVNINIH